MLSLSHMFTWTWGGLLSVHQLETEAALSQLSAKEGSLHWQQLAALPQGGA